jgi:hypothetical protein
VGAPAVASLQLSPAAASIALGTQQQFYAVGLFTDGSRRDVTAQAAFSTSDSSIASLATQAGAALGAAAGSAVISASLGGLTASSSLTVTSATLTAIQLSPDSPTIAAGTSLQLTATGIFSDATLQDLTAQAAWSSSSASTATVSAGAVAAVSSGNSTISASLGGVSGSTALTVTNATLTGIEISPLTPQIAIGTSAAFSAAGLFSDGSVQDVTGQASWSASDSSVAALSGSSATGLAAGTATISASLGGLTDSTLLTVTSATLASISVAAPSPSLPFGTDEQLSATGHFSDGTTQDLSAQVLWSSDDSTIATVSNAPGSVGLLLAIAPGTMHASAALLGVSGSAAITVSAATLSSIAVTPAASMLPMRYWTHFSATGTFSDGTTLPLTSQAVWSSSDTTVATVSNAARTAGVVSGQSAGAVTIAAQFKGVTGSTALTVFSGKPTSIAISPDPITVAAGQTEQLSAVATWANGFSMDVTAQVRWTSSNRALALVSNATRGLLRGVAAGSATISVKKNGVSGSAPLTVQ